MKQYLHSPARRCLHLATKGWSLSVHLCYMRAEMRGKFGCETCTLITLVAWISGFVATWSMMCFTCLFFLTCNIWCLLIIGSNKVCIIFFTSLFLVASSKVFYFCDLSTMWIWSEILRNLVLSTAHKKTIEMTPLESMSFVQLVSNMNVEERCNRLAN